MGEWEDLSDGELCARLAQRGVANPLTIVRSRDDERVAELITNELEW